VEKAHLLRFLALAGDDATPKLLDELRARLPRAGVSNGLGSWVVLTASVEAAALLGRRDEASRLYPLVEQLLNEGTAALWGEGLTERVAEIAAAAGERWDEAERHFEKALRQAHALYEEIGMPRHAELVDERRS
jgi:hypothetical protein